jgi:hypothetical protein
MASAVDAWPHGITAASSLILSSVRRSAVFHSASYLLLRLMALEILTGRSCALIFSIDLKAPRLRRLPVLAFFLREYKRYFQFTAANITTDG